MINPALRRVFSYSGKTCLGIVQIMLISAALRWHFKQLASS